MSQILSHYRRV